MDIQRQLPYSIIAEVGYTGTSSVSLPSGLLLNQLHPTYLAQGSALLRTVTNPFYGLTTDPASTLDLATVQYAQLLRPFPHLTAVNGVVTPTGHGNYHALEVKAECRFAQGLALLFNWTHSKSIDNLGEIGGSFG